MASRQRPVALLLAPVSPNALYGLAKNELLPALLPRWHVPVIVRLGNGDFRFDLLRKRKIDQQSLDGILKALVDAHMRAAQLSDDWQNQLRLIVAGVNFRRPTGIDDRAKLLSVLGIADHPKLTVLRERSGEERQFRHGAPMFEDMK